jgi:predicted nucleic acid-binding protein
LSFLLDASTLVPLVVVEPEHPDIWSFLAGHEAPFVATSFARGEVIAAISRALRKHRLWADQAAIALRDMESFYAVNCRSPAVEDSDIQVAASFVRRFDLALKLPDAIHLACAQRLSLPLLTLDRRLLRAADALGIAALAPD